MAELQQQLIWLGAGTARQPALNFSEFSQVTLVEAREDACIALQQAYSQPNISVLQQLISVEAESQSFTSYNLAEFSAISPIAGLKDLFPGLKTKSQERLQSQVVNVLIDQINTNQPLQPEANTLIIDIPDQAHSLLSKLIQTKQLTLFNTLVFPYGAELYAGMADIAVITELLNKQHFVLQGTDNSDPDLPLYSFKLDAAAKKVAQLNHKVKQLTEQLAAAQQSEANNRQQLEQQKAELSKQLEAAKQQASADKQQLEQQKVELAKQVEASKQQASAEKQQLEQQIAELSKQLEAAKQHAATEKQQSEQQKTELSKQLEAAKQQAATEKQQSEQQKAELGKQLEAAKQQAATEKQQSEQQKAELSKQLEAAKQQAATEKQQSEQQKAELSKQLEAVKQQASTDKQQLEQQKAELTKQLEQQKTDLSKQLESAKQQAAADKQQLDQQKAELNMLLQQEQSAHKVTSEKLAEVQNWFQSRKKQALELEEQLKIVQAELTLLKSQQVTNASIEALQASMQTLFQQQAQQNAQQLQQAANALGQHVTKMQHEQQSSLQHYLGLQHYLQTGEPILSPDSWAIAFDTLTELVTLLNTNNYDVIIEFGSGQSTTFIAKTLAHQNTELQQLVNNYRLAHKGRKSATTEIGTEHFVKDLPARIVSFEQSENYLNKTRQQLNEHGLAQFVELVLAPLVPASYANQFGTEPLFYNCNDKLAELAKVLANRQARILVVVDGPCSPTQDPLIRYAALPAILNNLAAHKLQIVLDDTKREGEHLVLKHWQQLCEQRGLQTKLTTWPTQKGAVLLEVTP